MIAVSNTSPLNYLVIIGKVAVLPALFDKLHIPATVRNELLAREAPEKVRQFALTLPPWIQVHEVEADPSFSVALHQGETDAILLAKRLSADVLLMDELEGRAAARELGLTVIGTLGVLDLAADRSLLDFRATWEALRATSFRAPARLVAELLARDETRRHRTP